jgi:hypothetical protein
LFFTVAKRCGSCNALCHPMKQSCLWYFCISEVQTLYIKHLPMGGLLILLRNSKIFLAWEGGGVFQWWTVVNIWLQKIRGIYRVFKGLLDCTLWSQLNAF